MVLPPIFALTTSFLTLLSDLPTPAFLLDVTAMQRFVFQPRATVGASTCCNVDSSRSDNTGTATTITTTSQRCTIPSVVLPHQGISLYPATACNDGKYRLQYDAPQCDTLFSDNDPMTTPLTSDVFCFLHASVVQTRSSKKDPNNTFIAELDLPPSLCRDLWAEPYLANRDPARLCLGLNNHHVGGYYW
jgi:hypothetical protein